MRGSCRYSLMSLVYSSSIFWGEEAAGAAGLAFLDWAKPGQAAIAIATISTTRVFTRVRPVIHRHGYRCQFTTGAPTPSQSPWPEARISKRLFRQCDGQRDQRFDPRHDAASF